MPIVQGRGVESPVPVVQNRPTRKVHEKRCAQSCHGSYFTTCTLLHAPSPALPPGQAPPPPTHTHHHFTTCTCRPCAPTCPARARTPA